MHVCVVVVVVSSVMQKAGRSGNGLWLKEKIVLARGKAVWGKTFLLAGLGFKGPTARREVSIEIALFDCGMRERDVVPVSGPLRVSAYWIWSLERRYWSEHATVGPNPITVTLRRYTSSYPFTGRVMLATYLVVGCNC
jgi:hypothetical protein